MEETCSNFAKISIVPALRCTNVNCKSIEHRHQVDSFYSQIGCALLSSSFHCIPFSKPSASHHYTVPGFNGNVKDLHSVAHFDYVA